MKVILSLGGSFIYNRTKDLSKLRDLVQNGEDSFVIVCGGGKLARDWINFGKLLNLNEDTLHRIGIKATQLNAFIISEYLKGVHFDGDLHKPPIGHLIVGGGFKPGDTTDIDAANAAIAVGAEVVFNMSKEDGVYDKDPEKFPKAKLMKNLSFDQLYGLTGNTRTPGMNFIFDPEAAKLCESHGIKVVVTSTFGDIKRYFKGQKLAGTIIG